MTMTIIIDLSPPQPPDLSLKEKNALGMASTVGLLTLAVISIAGLLGKALSRSKPCGPCNLS